MIQNMRCISVNGCETSCPRRFWAVWWVPCCFTLGWAILAGTYLITDYKPKSRILTTIWEVLIPGAVSDRGAGARKGVSWRPCSTWSWAKSPCASVTPLPHSVLDPTPVRIRIPEPRKESLPSSLPSRLEKFSTCFARHARVECSYSLSTETFTMTSSSSSPAASLLGPSISPSRTQCCARWASPTNQPTT